MSDREEYEERGTAANVSLTEALDHLAREEQQRIERASDRIARARGRREPVAKRSLWSILRGS